MRNLFSALRDALASGQDAVLVTVVASSGSTPRGAGARMVVTGQGRLCGTIGGGAVEYRSQQVAQELLRTGGAHLEHFRLHENQVQDLGMICGGAVDVYFRHIPAGDADTLALVGHMESLYRAGEPAWLICEITGGCGGAMGIYGGKSGVFGLSLPSALTGALGGKPCQLTDGGRSYYCEPLFQAGRVYVFGGGHVSQALVPALTAVDFRCVVLEDRPEFCRPELFPGVEETRLVDNARLADFVTVEERDYVVVMTRGHKDDQAVQAQMLRTPAHYIGVIGSRRKTAGVFARLREEGFTDADLARITTPIGLDIKAETPAEIAVSIAAQLIQVRAERAEH